MTSFVLKIISSCTLAFVYTCTWPARFYNRNGVNVNLGRDQNGVSVQVLMWETIDKECVLLVVESTGSEALLLKIL